MVQRGNDDGPRTFREVGYILVSIQQDIDQIKTSQGKVIGWVMTGFVLPLMVGLVIGYLFRK